MSVEKKEGAFADLLKSLQETSDNTEKLAKGPAKDDDATVAAAAADGGDAAAGDAGEAGANPEDEPDGEEFGKSLGEGMVDATDLLKSLMGRLDISDELLAKALPQVATTLATQSQVLKSQGDLIKSLQDEVKVLAGQGRGRKTLLTVAEKPGVADLLAKSDAADDGKITPDQLMAKSNAAYEAKKISGAELNTVDACLRNGWTIDPRILTKVAGA
ncbi:hypothetical protein [Tardiphaga sp. 862_B3_N1_1]|uniref:hypothetical protein n=1 Tax=Tardiphaga sp. 862_B3_N1_1 TaxID=3240763 RepID=UPI003F8BB22F